MSDSIGLPWVPEDFLVRFPVAAYMFSIGDLCDKPLVASAFGRFLSTLARKKPLVPRVQLVSRDIKMLLDTY